MLAAGLVLAAGAWWVTRPEIGAPRNEPAELLCRRTERHTVGRLADPALNEVSGVVASRRHDVLWMHNDSGDGPRVYAVDPTGALRATFDVQGAEAFDWEDLALAPGDQGDELYVGDIGDNGAVRETIVVYRFAEPEVDPDAAGPLPAAPAGPAERLELRYPDGPHDAETLLVDPLTRDVFVVTKDLLGRSAVYRAEAPLRPGPPVELEHVATLDLGLGGLATGGDISPGGDAVAVRTYFTVFVWGRQPGEGVVDALGRRPCAGPRVPEIQGEAIGFLPGGEGYVTPSEGDGSRIHRWTERAGVPGVAR